MVGMGSLSLRLKYLLSLDNLSAASICLKLIDISIYRMIEELVRIYLKTVLKAYGMTVTVMSNVSRRMIRVGKHCFTSYFEKIS